MVQALTRGEKRARRSPAKQIVKKRREKSAQRENNSKQKAGETVAPRNAVRNPKHADQDPEEAGGVERSAFVLCGVDPADVFTSSSMGRGRAANTPKACVMDRDPDLDWEVVNYLLRT